MKRFFLGLFILFDIGAIGASGYILTAYIRNQVASPSLPATAPDKAAAKSPLSSPSTMAVTAGSPTAGGAPPETSALNKSFSYRNSRAKHVAIRADFTGWKAAPMTRDDKGVWTYTIALTPGEYAYCYSVDDKPPLKDPANKRTKLIGRAVVSAIVVEAPSSTTPK